jgi:hypothetical protein
MDDPKEQTAKKGSQESARAADRAPPAGLDSFAARLRVKLQKREKKRVMRK